MNRRPRVLMVAPTGGAYGGIEAFTSTIAAEVIADGEFDVRVVFRLRGNEGKSPHLEERIQRHGIPWRLMFSPDLQYLKDLMWADVVNCHFPLLYATFPAKLLGKKLVVTVENRYMPEEHKSAHRWGLNLADACWYISSFVGRTWEGQRLRPKSEIVPAVSILPEGWVNPSERRGFLFIARWVPLKGLEPLVEAYATAGIDHAAHPLKLLGDGMLREKIEGMIRNTSVGQHIVCPGFVDQDEKTRLISGARWNIAPAAFPEDLGLSPIEARACGVPSIVTSIGGLPEAAGDSALTCDAGDVRTLRLAIETAAAMPEAEYVERARYAKDSLKTYLPRPRFYTERFNALLAIVRGGTNRFADRS